MKKVSPGRIKSIDRHTLELLVRRDSHEDLSVFTDEELLDVIMEIYPQDVIASMDFACAKIESSKKPLTTYDKAPLYFSNTSVDVIVCDPHWYYVFWSISPNEKAMLLDKDKDCALSLCIRDVSDSKLEKQNGEICTIDVGFQESDRNIFVQANLSSVTVDFIAYVNGEKTVLASSKTYNFFQPYLKTAVASNKLSAKQKKLQFMPIENEDGNLVVNNAILEEIHGNLKGECL